MSILDNAVYRKCEQVEESSYHILYQCPAVAGHRTKIFSSKWVELIYISRASNRQVLAIGKRTRPLKGPIEDKGIQWTQWWPEC
jgi:hypothetical protein